MPEMCNHDCFNCQYSDCIVETDTAESDEIENIPFMVGYPDREIIYGTSYTESQKRYNQSAGGKERSKRYDLSQKGKERYRQFYTTDKGKELLRQYELSEKGKERHKRYLCTEKGKAMLKTQKQKMIASGKNAEYCRRYRLRKKLEKLNGFT